MSARFEKELNFFIAHQEELVGKYRGKILVLVGEEVVGVHNTYLEAYNEARKRYEDGTFMLQLCIPGPEAYTVSVYSSQVTGMYTDALTRGFTKKEKKELHWWVTAIIRSPLGKLRHRFGRLLLEIIIKYGCGCKWAYCLLQIAQKASKRIREDLRYKRALILLTTLQTGLP